MTESLTDQLLLDQTAVDARRGGYAGETVPITGFGPAGTLTLQLPPATANHWPVLRDGKWVQARINAWALPEAVERERQRFVGVAARASASGGLRYMPDVLPSMMDFAAAVILQAYTFDDAELEQLLVNNTLGWIKGLLPYVGDGDDLIRQVDRWMPAAPVPVVPLRDSEPAAPVQAAAATAADSVLQRAKRRPSISWPWRRKK